MAKKPDETMQDVAKQALADKAAHAEAQHAADLETASIAQGEIAATQPKPAPAPAMSDDDDDFTMHSAAHLSPVKQVTLPVLKWPANNRLVFKIVGPIEQGKELKETKRGPKMQPANVMKVAGARGGLRVKVVETVLGSELQDNYPDRSYVGRWFAVQKFEATPDKQAEAKARGLSAYSTFHIIEIADPTAPAPVGALEPARPVTA